MPIPFQLFFLHQFIYVLILTSPLAQIVHTYQPNVCTDALDIVHVQDTTSSFQAAMKNITKQMEVIFKLMEQQHADTQYAFAVFGDKPLAPAEETTSNLILGFPSDFCFDVVWPLNKPFAEETLKLMSSVRLAGGGDWSEIGVEALYRAAISPQIGWREERHNLSRVIIFVTDSTSHFAGDVLKVTGKSLPSFNLTSKIMLEQGPNAACIDNEYPTMEQVARVLKEKNIFVLLLAAPGGVYSKSDGKFSPAKSLAVKGKEYRTEDGLLNYYSELFDRSGISYLATTVRPDMLDLSDILEFFLSNFKGEECR